MGKKRQAGGLSPGYVKRIEAVQRATGDLVLALVDNHGPDRPVMIIDAIRRDLDQMYVWLKARQARPKNCRVQNGTLRR